MEEIIVDDPQEALRLLAKLTAGLSLREAAVVARAIKIRRPKPEEEK